MSASRVCAVSDLVQDEPIKVIIDEQPICIVKDSNGDIHAIGDTCTHGQVSLSEGFVEDGTVECWAHGSRFSLSTGAALNLPAYEPVPVYVVEIVDDEVRVDPAVTKPVSQERPAV